jgi:transmembrane sensor
MRGEQRVVTLADGSVIILNTDTRLAVHMSAATRQIVLERGEALFQVTRDPQRPFLVRAGAGMTRALGTQFNVLLQDGGAIVSVLQGAVEVGARSAGEQQNGEERPDGRKVLAAGQSAAYTARGQLVSPEPTHASADRIAAWREGKLRFESWPLERAVREYNRYATKPIRLEVEPDANIQISGIFRIGDSTTFVEALGELVGAKVADWGEVLVLQSPRSKLERS